jgi:hypothetical protein
MRRKHPHIGFASLLASSASSYCRTFPRTRPDCRYDVHRKCFRLWAALCSLPATLSPADIRNCYLNGDRYRRYRIMVTSPLEVQPRGPRRAVTDRIRAPPADHPGDRGGQFSRERCTGSSTSQHGSFEKRTLPGTARRARTPPSGHRQAPSSSWAAATRRSTTTRPVAGGQSKRKPCAGLPIATAESWEPSERTPRRPGSAARRRVPHPRPNYRGPAGCRRDRPDSFR